jgi:hypothetical protein
VRSWTFIYVAIAALIPLFIFAGKLPAQGFRPSSSHVAFTDIFWLNKVLSAPIYFVLVPLVEFIAIPFLLLLVIRYMQRAERYYLAAAFGFFALTYILAYSGYNNFAMRGMFLPSFVFFFLFAKYYVVIFEQLAHFMSTLHLARLWPLTRYAIIVALLVTTIGVVKASYVLFNDGMRGTLLSYQIPFLAAIYGSTPPARMRGNYRDIVWNEEIVSVQPAKAERRREYKYNMEKFIDTLSIEEMAGWEQELVRLPRRGLLR